MKLDPYWTGLGGGGFMTFNTPPEFWGEGPSEQFLGPLGAHPDGPWLKELSIWETLSDKR